MSGAVPPKRPRQPFGVGCWQQLAGCRIRLQSCLPHRHWGKIHKGHCRGKMLVRKTNGLFSFFLGFYETSTFTSHLSSTFFYPALFSRVSLAAGLLCGTEPSRMPMMAWGESTLTSGSLGVVHSYPQQSWLQSSLFRDSQLIEEVSCLNRASMLLGQQLAWGLGDRKRTD